MAQPSFLYGDPAKILDRKRSQDEKIGCKVCIFNIVGLSGGCCFNNMPQYPNVTAHSCDKWQPKKKER